MLRRICTRTGGYAFPVTSAAPIVGGTTAPAPAHTGAGGQAPRRGGPSHPRSPAPWTSVFGARFPYTPRMSMPKCKMCEAAHWPRDRCNPRDVDKALGLTGKRGKSPRRGTDRTAQQPAAVQIAPATGSTGGRSFDSPGKGWCAGWRCRCGHEWLTKGERPTRCPKCKARTWDRGDS